jgi:hypothetical protein
MYRETFYFQTITLAVVSKASLSFFTVFVLSPKQINIGVQQTLNAPLNFSSPAAHVPHSTSVPPGLLEPF